MPPLIVMARLVRATYAKTVPPQVARTSRAMTKVGIVLTMPVGSAPAGITKAARPIASDVRR